MALDIEKRSNDANDQFDKAFKSYVDKMRMLHKIMNRLNDLSRESNQRVFSYNDDEGQEYAKYFNEQNSINNERNNEYIESMLKYVIKQQKELVDEMYDKLYLDREEVEETEKDK